METFVKPVLGRTLEECMADGVPPGEVTESYNIKRGDQVQVGGVTMTALGMVGYQKDSAPGFVRYFDPRTAGGKAWCWVTTWWKWVKDATPASA